MALLLTFSLILRSCAPVMKRLLERNALILVVFSFVSTAAFVVRPWAVSRRWTVNEHSRSGLRRMREGLVVVRSEPPNNDGDEIEFSDDSSDWSSSGGDGDWSSSGEGDWSSSGDGSGSGGDAWSEWDESGDDDGGGDGGAREVEGLSEEEIEAIDEEALLDAIQQFDVEDEELVSNQASQPPVKTAVSPPYSSPRAGFLLAPASPDCYAVGIVALLPGGRCDDDARVCVCFAAAGPPPGAARAHGGARRVGGADPSVPRRRRACVRVRDRPRECHPSGRTNGSTNGRTDGRTEERHAEGAVRWRTVAATCLDHARRVADREHRRRVTERDSSVARDPA